MRPLEGDILYYVLERFDESDVPTVLDILGNPALTTPRVQRAVLYLSGGSIAMLEHYAKCAERDVREVILRSEFVLNVADAPMRVRSMNEPMTAHLVPAAPRRGPVQAPARTANGWRRAGRGEAAGYHDALKGSRFQLGEVEYIVAGQQSEPTRVRCIRCRDDVVSLVRLPLVFVLEQLSEHIELEAL